jgi:hypothetical protein
MSSGSNNRAVEFSLTKALCGIATVIGAGLPDAECPGAFWPRWEVHEVNAMRSILETILPVFTTFSTWPHHLRA